MMMQRLLMIAFLSMLGTALADEPKATTDVLQERLEKIEWQIRAYRAEFANLVQAQKEIAVELEKRKAEAKVEAKPPEPAK
jgi:hypothetical protein